MAKDEDLGKFTQQLQAQIMEQIRTQYSEAVIDRWQNPRNCVPLNHPDGYARVIGKNPTGELEKIRAGTENS